VSVLAAGCGGPPPRTLAPAPMAAQQEEVNAALRAVESGFRGRLGLYALATGTGESISYRAGERFPMCSTVKLLIVSAILHRNAGQPGLLAETIHYTPRQLVHVSPVTELHVADGMTVAQLCAAAIIHSDCTAANLLMSMLGGPTAVTAYARGLGDPTTRSDRYELALNDVAPGDQRDTTTPAAMARNLHSLALGSALSPADRQLLVTWLMADTIGNARIRAGVPPSWRLGDKPGTGGIRSEVNDVAVAWPPGHSPLVIAIYSSPADPHAAPNEKVLAAATKIVTGALVRQP
jgi:beta-lactamase class A